MELGADVDGRDEPREAARAQDDSWAASPQGREWLL